MYLDVFVCVCGGQVAEASRGVANITHMLLMTRLYNAMSSVASMRRQV